MKTWVFRRPPHYDRRPKRRVPPVLLLGVTVSAVPGTRTLVIGGDGGRSHVRGASGQRTLVAGGDGSRTKVRGR